MNITWDNLSFFLKCSIIGGFITFLVWCGIIGICILAFLGGFLGAWA